jgi:hypothetical protein
MRCQLYAINCIWRILYKTGNTLLQIIFTSQQVKHLSQFNDTELKLYQFKSSLIAHSCRFITNPYSSVVVYNIGCQCSESFSHAPKSLMMAGIQRKSLLQLWNSIWKSSFQVRNLEKINEGSKPKSENNHQIWCSQ